MEIVPAVLAASIGILTVTLAFVGFQIVRILSEAKKSVEKVNKMLDDAGRMTESIAGPTSSISGIFFGLKTGLKVLKVLLGRKKGGKGDE